MSGFVAATARSAIFKILVVTSVRKVRGIRNARNRIVLISIVGF